MGRDTNKKSSIKRLAFYTPARVLAGAGGPRPQNELFISGEFRSICTMLNDDGFPGT